MLVSVRTHWFIISLQVCMNVCVIEWCYAAKLCQSFCIQQWLYACIYVCMYISMYVCLYVCMFVCMYDCMYVCMYVCVYVCIYVCIYVCMYIIYYHGEFIFLSEFVVVVALSSVYHLDSWLFYILVIISIIIHHKHHHSRHHHHCYYCHVCYRLSPPHLKIIPLPYRLFLCVLFLIGWLHASLYGM